MGRRLTQKGWVVLAVAVGTAMINAGCSDEGTPSAPTAGSSGSSNSSGTSSAGRSGHAGIGGAHGGSGGAGTAADAGHSGASEQGGASGGLAGAHTAGRGGDGNGPSTGGSSTHGGEAGETGDGGAGLGGDDAGGASGNSGSGTGGAATGGAPPQGDAGASGLAGQAGNGSEPDTCEAPSRACCRTGTMACLDGIWGECAGGVPESAESCNGEDDDCDGEVDEGLGTFSCGIGACRRTIPGCVEGAVSVCTPGAPAAAVDACNGEDDDCDGAVDEDCSACIRVSPTGDDAAAALDATGQTPFANVATAIAFAASHRNIATRVCVAAGSSCGSSASYSGPSGADLVMADGIDVLGGYESTTFTRCSNSTTTLLPNTAAGIVFGASVASRTVLDGFSIVPFNGVVTTGITVDGARGVLLSNLSIVNPVRTGHDEAYGIRVTNGAEVVSFRNRVDPGHAQLQAIGVHSVGSRVDIADSCRSGSWLQSDRCSDSCATAPATAPLIRGEHQAVWFENSPGSRIERSLLCSYGQTVRTTGDATGVIIRGSSVHADYDPDAECSALRFESCTGSPWVVGNHSLTATARSSSDRTTAVVGALGACTVVVDGNPFIAGVGSTGGRLTGVSCEAAGGVPSRCVVSDNTVFGAQATGSTSTGLLYDVTAVRCAAGSCTRIDTNTLVGRAAAGQCSNCRYSARGLWLEGSNAFTDRNVIRGGCGADAIGILAAESAARIQNNDVTGYARSDCSGDYGPSASHPRLAAGLSVVAGVGAELDVHSNALRSRVGAYDREPQSGVECVGAGLRLATAGGFAEPSGIFRNNLIATEDVSVSGCSGYSVVELDADADPRVFQNNSHAGYRDEGTTTIHSGIVNTLTDTTASGNVPPCSWPFAPGSPCLDGGTPTGAPLWDIDGDARAAPPDIGPDEIVSP